MNDNNKKISKILEKYKSSFSKNDLLNLESLLSNELESIKSYSLFTDGACEFDDEYRPINAGIGGVIKFDEEILFSFSENIGVKTNNEAEYLALIQGLNLCIDNEIIHINIYSDSELIVKQINGEYKVKNERMSVLLNKLMNFFPDLIFGKLTMF